MCLRVFCEGNNEMYQALKDDARSLGSAFQKVNFLRDIKSDFQERGRTYFPNVDFTNFTLKINSLLKMIFRLTLMPLTEVS
jgi:phytoene/squalene synthetase